MVRQAVLPGNVTEACHHEPTNRSKDRDGPVGTREIVLKLSTSQEATAGDDDPVKWIADEGNQVSKDLFR